MKKRLCMLLIAALLVLLVPHVASANAPIPWAIEIACSNIEEGTQVDVVVLKEDGTTRTQHAEDPQRGIFLSFDSDETSFYIVCTAPDGTETRSETVELAEYGQYRFDGATNRLTRDGSWYSRKDKNSCSNGILWALLLVLLFVLALGLTLLFEFLVALCFGIRPKKYVFIINLIINPVMNLLLFLLAAFDPDLWFYCTALGVLELVAVVLEFLFYRRKYPQYTGVRLFFFSLTANVVSFALGCAALCLLL